MLISCPNFMVQFVIGYLPLTYCRVVSDIGFMLFFSLLLHTGFMAYERYLFFCRPFDYAAFLPTARVMAVLATGYLVSLIYTVVTEVLIGRFYHSSVITCNLPDSAVQSLVQFVIFFLPSGVVTIFSAVRIWRLARRSRVAPATVVMSAAMGGMAGAGRASAVVSSRSTPVKQAYKGLRMILLVSGTLWGTIMPHYAVRIIIFNAGYTWHDLDSRRHLMPAIAMRIATFVGTTVSSAVNPIIFYYSRKDLRTAALKLLRRKTAA